MPRIDIGGIRLNYVEAGKGEVLLFIPGLIGLHQAWDCQIPHFAKHYRCVTFDHRGVGESDKPAGKESYSTRIIAADVIALLDALGIEKATAIGTSTGGCVLQNLALDHPKRLGRCVFSNTWTRADVYVERVQTFRKRIARSFGADAYVEFSSIFTNGPLQFRHDLDGVMELEKRSKESIGPLDVITARIDMTLAHDRLAELDRIDRPSLIIGTRDDLTVPAYFAEDLHAAIKGSKLVILPEGGHYAYRRKPDAWNAVVEKFLAETKAA
jgi:aminoacrylate hydrolase